MTREELEEIRDLQLEIMRCQYKLHILDMRSPASSPIAGAVHGSGISDKIGNTAEQRISLENKIAALQSEVNRRKAYINAIQDYDMREIIYCKCIHGFTFYEISKRVGMPKNTIKTRYYRFFQNVLENP